MIFLLLAILCSAALPLLFRAFDDWRVNLFGPATISRTWWEPPAVAT
jgi:hypothetical protein